MTRIEQQIRACASLAWYGILASHAAKARYTGTLEYADGSEQPIIFTIQLGEKKGGSHGH